MTDDEFAPEDAFALFGHDLRVAILLELADAEGRSLSFSELRERVGERDSGKFNYHLRKLVGRFVGHEEETDEYRLLYPGHWIIDVMATGVATEQASVRDVDLAADCVHCGGPLGFAYDATKAGRVKCRDCEHILVGFPFDPGGLTDREGREVARTYDWRTRTAWECALEDVCPVCSGRVEAGFDGSVSPRLAATQGHPVLIALDCQQCSFFVNVPVGAQVARHSPAVAFLSERGVDVRERRLWELPFVVDPDAVAVRERDPWRVAVTVAADGDERTATVEESLAVVAFE